MHETVDETQVRSARRRLIRGAFATPAVLALHSGSAVAAASSLNCVKYQVSHPVYPAHAAAPDTYLRAQLYALWDGVAGASNVLGWYIAGSSVEAARFGNAKAVNAFLRSGEFRAVVLQTGGTVSLGATVLTAPPGPPDRFVLGPKWVALRVNPTQTGGNVELIGVVDGTLQGSAVTGSCWSSFTGLGVA